MSSQLPSETYRHPAHSQWSAAGFRYPDRIVSHAQAWQHERLLASDVDPACYGDIAEAGLFGLDCFAAMVEAGHDIDGYLFIDQTLVLERPPRLDEPLVLSGQVDRLVPVRRGLLAEETYRLRDQAGALCIETRLRGIVAPLPADVATNALEPMPARSPVPADGWIQIESKQLTPEKVRAFSEDVGNDLHFDPVAARAYGFRAPLAQGVMSVVYLLGALATQAPARRMNVHIEFLRPVFWDSPVTLWQHGIAGDSGGRRVVQSRNESGKATANLIASTLSYA
ncbi:hypothetical protein [Castellaniella sp. GW247-6E4]|uniref:hypothetical protein n=1 Tax=Castellaniella sp. GW247-6E4 TaxID=3140380 RepID=UPI003314ADDC